VSKDWNYLKVSCKLRVSCPENHCKIMLPTKIERTPKVVKIFTHMTIIFVYS